MAYCIYCGARLEKDALFCTQCGKPTEEAPAKSAPSLKKEPCCPHCGAQADKDDLFCTQCGKPLKFQQPPKEQVLTILEFMASDIAGEMELGGWEEVLDERKKKSKRK